MTRPVTIVLAALSALALAAPGSASDEAIDRAMGVLDEFMAAFNARDEEKMVATMHFPHVRIASGTTSVEASAESLMASFDFANFAERFDWHHSAWVAREVVQSGPDKVHVATRFARYREDGSVSAEFDSLYIVSLRGGRWGITGRSSFAP